MTKAVSIKGRKLLAFWLVQTMLLSMLLILWRMPVAAAAIKCYTINRGNTTVYSDANLSNPYGAIFDSDEVTVLSVTSSYSLVRYPISGGRTKTGYIPTSAILTAVSGNSYKAGARITTYKRPNGNSYGYIDRNDTVTVFQSSDGYTQLKYPVSGGYKYAFVRTSDAENYITGSNASGNVTQIQEGTYIFRSGLNYNKVMDAYGDAGLRDGTNIQLCSYHGDPNQRYTVSHVGSGWYKIICNWGSKSLDVRGAVRGNEVNVELCGYHGGANQLWRFVSAGNGYYYIQSGLGYYLDVWDARTADETNIQTCELNGGDNQKWKLDPVTTNTSSYQQQTGTNVNYSTQTVRITGWPQTVDSFNGVSAQYFPGTGNTDTGDYCCAGYVSKYYRSIYGVTVYNMFTGATPRVNAGRITQTNNPQPGDIGYQTNSRGSGHWFIVKAVNGNTCTIIEQNWKWKSNGSTYCYVNRKVTRGSTNGLRYFHWSR